MASIKQYRNRVRSVKSTQKITKAMQMVAASKLKKVKSYLSDSETYLDILSGMITDISASNMVTELAEKEQKFFNNKTASSKADLLVVMTSERGLCGSFNSSIIRQVKADMLASEKAGKNVRLIVIGRKGYDALKGKYLNNIESYFNISNEYKEILFLEIKEKIVEMIEKDKIKNCFIYFNRFKNAMMQTVTKKQILPIQAENNLSPPHNYEYEGEKVILDIINLYLDGQINFSLLHSQASEEGARMTAMDNATKNAGEIIETVTLQLNRTRQGIITKELIEIISGAEAS